MAPGQHCATDLCRVLARTSPRSGKVTTAASALEQALIMRFGMRGRVVTKPFLLRSDNGLVFNSLAYTCLVRRYGLNQEFIALHRPQQNGMVKRVIRSLPEQCGSVTASRPGSMRRLPSPAGSSSIATGAHTRSSV